MQRRKALKLVGLLVILAFLASLALSEAVYAGVVVTTQTIKVSPSKSTSSDKPASDPTQKPDQGGSTRHSITITTHQIPQRPARARRQARRAARQARRAGRQARRQGGQRPQGLREARPSEGNLRRRVVKIGEEPDNRPIKPSFKAAARTKTNQEKPYRAKKGELEFGAGKERVLVRDVYDGRVNVTHVPNIGGETYRIITDGPNQNGRVWYDPEKGKTFSEYWYNSTDQFIHQWAAQNLQGYQARHKITTEIIGSPRYDEDPSVSSSQTWTDILGNLGASWGKLWQDAGSDPFAQQTPVDRLQKLIKTPRLAQITAIDPTKSGKAEILGRFNLAQNGEGYRFIPNPERPDITGLNDLKGRELNFAVRTGQWDVDLEDNKTKLLLDNKKAQRLSHIVPFSTLSDLGLIKIIE